jgi:hypothetical protein
VTSGNTTLRGSLDRYQELGKDWYYYFAWQWWLTLDLGVWDWSLELLGETVYYSNWEVEYCWSARTGKSWVLFLRDGLLGPALITQAVNHSITLNPCPSDAQGANNQWCPPWSLHQCSAVTQSLLKNIRELDVLDISIGLDVLNAGIWESYCPLIWFTAIGIFYFGHWVSVCYQPNKYWLVCQLIWPV